VTALLGSPLLLWLLPRLTFAASPPRLEPGAAASRVRHPWLVIGGLTLALALLVFAALAFGRGPDGWLWSRGEALEELLPWRAPRAFGALAAGVMLAVAGTMMQRLTGNPMASPELLGISSGASLGLVVLLFLDNGPGHPAQLTAAALGAGVTLAAILGLGRGRSFTPDRMLLVGVALGACFDAILVALLAAGDPRATRLLAWMAGSTYRVTADAALVAGGLAALLCALAVLCTRWLDLLPLGDGAAKALGLELRRSRLCLLLVTALLTAGATLVAGPISFVGLMAPHLARMLGARRALHQMVMAALLGGLILTGADWLGRMILFPRQVPMGLLATLIGGPFLLWSLYRRGAGSWDRR
jgi:iron complex transport system permease protein